MLNGLIENIFKYALWFSFYSVLNILMWEFALADISKF